jgi:hypothetical protein
MRLAFLDLHLAALAAEVEWKLTPSGEFSVSRIMIRSTIWDSGSVFYKAGFFPENSFIHFQIMVKMRISLVGQLGLQVETYRGARRRNVHSWTYDGLRGLSVVVSTRC